MTRVRSLQRGAATAYVALLVIDLMLDRDRIGLPAAIVMLAVGYVMACPMADVMIDGASAIRHLLVPIIVLLALLVWSSVGSPLAPIIIAAFCAGTRLKASGIGAPVADV